MLPMHLFSSRTYATASAVSVLAYFGLFGTLFLLGQRLGPDPLSAGVQLLPMTAPMALAAPAGGRLSDRFGPQPVMTCALIVCAAALAWLATDVAPLALVLLGVGAACLFAPIQATLLEHAGVAVALRELGGVLGVAVLAAVLGAHGFRAALAVAAGALALAALVTLALRQQLDPIAPRVRGVEPADARQRLVPLHRRPGGPEPLGEAV
jgi:MFS family permease